MSNRWARQRSATSWPPSTTATYSSGKASAISFCSTAVERGDLELALMTAVLPPAMAAVSTPRERRKGKLKGLMISAVP